MKGLLTLIMTSFLALPNIVSADGGTIEYKDGRLKIQLRLKKEESQGSYQLRSILEQHGFKNENGFIKTREALAPLEIYNYLYDDGRYVFTIFLPTDDAKFNVSFYGTGDVYFTGIAAQKLFDLIKLYVPKNATDNPNLEQYMWFDGRPDLILASSFCDKNIQEEYRCWLFG